MKYKMSKNIAVRTKSIDKAKEFYSEFLGFSVNEHTQTELELDANPMTLYVIDDKNSSGPIMELYVNDLEKAKNELISKGCKILKWEGRGKDCYVQDPFGVIFNIWEEKK